MPRQKKALPTKEKLSTHVVRCNTVGDLLDALAVLAKDSVYQDVMDASIDSHSGDCFTAFRITQRRLSDKSTVLDFELFEELS